MKRVFASAYASANVSGIDSNPSHTLLLSLLIIGLTFAADPSLVSKDLSDVRVVSYRHPIFCDLVLLAQRSADAFRDGN